MTSLILLFAIGMHWATIATLRSMIGVVEADAPFNKRLGITTFPSVKMLRGLLNSLYWTLGLLVMAVIVYFLER